MASNVVAIASKQSTASINDVNLLLLLPKKYQAILKGILPVGETTESLLKAAIKECYGWNNFALAQGKVTSCPKSLVKEFANILKVDESKADEILGTVSQTDCKPREQSAKGGLQKCANRLARAFKQSAKVNEQPRPTSHDIELESTDTPGRVAMRELYGDDGHICINDNVYRFTGTYYELVDPGKRRHDIAQIMNRCFQLEDSGEVTRPYATNRHTSDAYNYSASLMRSVKPDEVNQGGINCLQWGA